MITLETLRNARADAEEQFQRTLETIPHARAGFDDLTRFLAEAQGYHREVCANYAAELSLISNGTLITPSLPHSITP